MPDREANRRRAMPSGVSRLALIAGAALVFAIDANLPLGVTIFVLYLPIIWLAYISGRIVDLYATAVMCTLLVLVDVLVSPAGGEAWQVFVNRSLGIVAIWVMLAVGVQIIAAKRKLAARNRLSRSILESALDAVISMDVRGNVLDWNPRAERIFGWSRSEACGQELASLIIPAPFRELHRAGLAHYLETGEGPVLNERNELTALRKDGVEIPVELTVIATDIGRGGTVFNAFVRDITQQRETLSELAESREKFRLLLDSTAEAIYGIDVEGRCTFCNTVCVRVLGYETDSELLGQDMHSLIHHTRSDGSHCPLAECRIHQSVQRGEGTHAECDVFWRKDGASLPVEYWSYPIRRGRQLLGAVITFLDITDRLESARYRARMAALVDSSYDAIISKDMAGNIVSWNLGAERVYGFSEDEAAGRTIGILLPPGVEQEEPEILRAISTKQRLSQFETLRRHKDGSLIDVSLTVSPIVDDDGEIIGSSSIERDITERRRNEFELRKAKEAAEQASRARSEFLANVSHELRTPMNAVIGMTQLALDEDLTEETREYVRTANESAHSLLTLLNDILDFSKIESGTFSIESEPFRLRETVEESVKTVATRAFEKGVELVCDVAADVPEHLIGDGLRLRQVLTNLVSNAVKFTDRGEVVVTVQNLRSWPRETRLQFVVRDTGVGIPREDLLRILKPFEQVDASSTRRFGGAGLGLAICSELLELMGGRLSVDSELGKGSAFSFELLLAREAGRVEESDDAATVRLLRNTSVLIVDDNQTNREILVQTLAKWSMRPDTAGGGAAALVKLARARAAGSPFRLIIVDALMPEMDGYMLSRQIVDRFADAPPVILMASSSDRREFKDREADAHVAVFMQKPVSQPELKSAIVKAMRADGEPPAPVIAKNGLNAPAPRNALSLLLAEDTPANQAVVTSILKKRGHSVTIAANGREAVELFRSARFDLVLMDIQMPILDGFQATAAIRAVELHRDRSTPIIAMTAHAMRGDREKCLQAGMDAYIAKPFDVKQLLELVEDVAARGAIPRVKIAVDGMAADSARDVAGDVAAKGTAAKDTAEDIAAKDTAAEEGAARVTSEEDIVAEESAADGAANDAAGDPASAASAPSGEEGPPIVDFAGAMRRLANDRELFGEMIGYFDDESPRLLEALRQAAARGDTSAVRLAAHSMKGLASNFGARDCVAAAQELERSCQAGDSGLAKLAAALECEWTRLDAALQDYRRAP